MPRNPETREPSPEDEPITPSFLEGYKVHEKEEAVRAAERKELHTGERGIVADRTKRVQAYMERLENVFLNEDEETRERNIALLKPAIYENTLIGKKNFPDSYFEFQKKQSRERGLGEISFTEEEKEKEKAKVIESQRLSLDSWIDYLTGDDCKYPADIKFFAMQGVLRLGKFDTEKYSFARRNKDTTAPFCEIDREALSIVMGALDAKHHDGDFSGYPPQLLALIDKKKSFGDMYAETMRDLDSKAERKDLLPITDGEWRVFEKGSDPQVLSDALAGKRSNLCIADIGSATRYLNTGSVEVFFSYDRAEEPTVPRIAIALNEEEVYEVRGTFDKNENLDPYISETDTLSRRIKDLPGGEAFMVKDACMKQMTALEKKVGRGEELTKDELIFLYGVRKPIKGFGYGEDPRIKELQDKRDKRKDYSTIFDCEPEQIALEEREIKEETVACAGDVDFKGFDTLSPNLIFIGGGAYFANSGVENLAQLQSIGGIADFRLSGVKNLGQLKNIGKDGYFRDSQVEDLGQLQDIGGDANFIGSRVKSLKQLQSVGGSASFIDSQTEDLGQLQSIEGSADFRGSQVKNLNHLQRVGGYADFRGSRVENLGQLQNIGGGAVFEGSQVESLGQLQNIGGSVNFMGSRIESLGQLQTIGGGASFRNSGVRNLGQLRSIGGSADFGHSEIEDLGQLQDIGGPADFMGSRVERLGQLQRIGGKITIGRGSRLDFSKVKHGEITE